MKDETILIQINESRLREIISETISHSLDSAKSLDSDSCTILSSKGAAAFLNISLPTLHRWKTDGLIPFHQKGGRVFFIQSELIESVKQSK